MALAIYIDSLLLYMVVYAFIHQQVTTIIFLLTSFGHK